MSRPLPSPGRGGLLDIVKQRRGLIETPHAKLDALVYTNPQRGGGAAVILHPYAMLGGSMQDHMVSELFRAAASSPAFSLVVRYNQRGVGRSSGSMNVRGKEDMVDVLDVVEWAVEQVKGPDKQVAVIGYSWGSCLAAYAMSHPAVVAYVGVSFPLGGLSWVLQTKKHFGEVCRASHVPRLLILGDQDQFTKEAALREAVLGSGGALLRQDDSFQPEANAAAAGSGPAAGRTAPAEGTMAAAVPAAAGLPGGAPRQLLMRVFPDSDHFWMSYGSLAAEYAVGWLEALVQPHPQGAAEEDAGEAVAVRGEAEDALAAPGATGAGASSPEAEPTATSVPAASAEPSAAAVAATCAAVADLVLGPADAALDARPAVPAASSPNMNT